MTNLISSFIFILFSYSAIAATAIPIPTISISDIRTYCIGRDPYVHVSLKINNADVGRPGLIYVGSHNSAQTQGQFYSSHWSDVDGQLFPIHSIERSGLFNKAIDIPLNDLTRKSGWDLYVGYGVLTVKDDADIQNAINSVAKIKEKFPEKKIPMIDPEYYKRVLIQSDMTKNAKYHYVRTWTPELINLCGQQGGH